MGKQKTALQQAIAEFTAAKAKAESLVDLIYLDGVLVVLDTFLPTERQQIEQAFSDGFNDFMVENYLTAADYYEQTYNEQK
jgi:hypothetical protein